MFVSIIAAIAENGVIGLAGALPWEGKLPLDLSFFQNTTRGHTVVAGRKTFQSILARNGKPLPKRTNIVVSRTIEKVEGVLVVPTLDDAIAAAPEGESELFVIGGTMLYAEALTRAHRLYLTRIEASFDGDVFFPELKPDQWRRVWSTPHPADEKNLFPVTIELLERKVS